MVLDGDSLIDPMSLADYPELMTGSALVAVEVPAGETYPDYQARLAQDAEGKEAEGKESEGGGKVAEESKE